LNRADNPNARVCQRTVEVKKNVHSRAELMLASRKTQRAQISLRPFEFVTATD